MNNEDIYYKKILVFFSKYYLTLSIITRDKRQVIYGINEISDPHR